MLKKKHQEPFNWQKALESRPVTASAPCRVDMGGTLDIRTFSYPLQHLAPCTLSIALEMRTTVSLTPYARGRIRIDSRGFKGADYAAGQAPYDHPMGLMFAMADFFRASGVQISHSFRIAAPQRPGRLVGRRRRPGGRAFGSQASPEPACRDQRPLHRVAGPCGRGKCRRRSLRLPGPAGRCLRGRQRLALDRAAAHVGLPAAERRAPPPLRRARGAPAGGLLRDPPRIPRHQRPLGAAVRLRPHPAALGGHRALDAPVRGRLEAPATTARPPTA